MIRIELSKKAKKVDFIVKQKTLVKLLQSRKMSLIASYL